MKGYADRLSSMHHYSRDTVTIEECYHTRLAKSISTWGTPLHEVDDVAQVSSTVYVVQAEINVTIRRSSRGTFRCDACRSKECPHVRRLETVAKEHPDFGIVVDDTAPLDGVVQGRRLPRDAIEVVQQKIALAPKPSTDARRPNRTGQVAKVYDVQGHTEYVYAEDESLDTLREKGYDHIFRYSREVWFTHDLVHRYIDTMAKGNACFDAFHNTMELQYARIGQRFCSKPTTRMVLQAAMYHLDVDMKAALTCDACSEIPVNHRIFILDGTSNGFLNRTKTPRFNASSCTHQTPRPGRAFTVVPNGTQRALVLACGDMMKDQYLRGLLKVEVHGIVEFARHALDHCSKDAVLLFMKDIASPYPIICTVHREMVLPDGGVLKRCSASISIEDRETLRRSWPSLWGLLSNFRAIPVEWRRLLHTITSKAVDIYRSNDTSHLGWERTDEEHPNVWFPEFPRRRINPWPRQASSFEESCTKHTLQHRHFSPGLFLICCPHGVILGLVAMQSYESVHTAFELIVERFVIPPGMIIYDNGCNLFRYGMMRCPGLFSQIRIMIDRFHSPGHILCPPSCTFQYYPDDVRVMLDRLTYGDLNTQAVEQTNGRLRKFQQSLGFMTQENYLAFVKVIASLLNVYKT